MGTKWHNDAGFLAVAAVAWPYDYDAAVRRRISSARTRMKFRWEGYYAAAQIVDVIGSMENRIDRCKAAVAALRYRIVQDEILVDMETPNAD